MSEIEIRVSSTKEKVAEDFCEFFKQQIESKNSFNVALSGGSTPKIVFELLAKSYHDLDWSKVHFYWGDERCVPPDNSQSNYKMTFESLFKQISISDSNIHRIRGEERPEIEAIRYSEEISKNLPSSNEYPQFDLMILGLGDDGHTASIFPDQMQLLKENSFCAVATHPISGQNRITITGNTLNNSTKTAFLVTGQGKTAIVDTIINGKNGAANYPAYHIQPKGDLIWFLDKNASGSNV